MKNQFHVLAIVFACLFWTSQAQPASAQGHFEFGFHYSRWSMNILRSYIEEGLGDSLESDLKSNILEDIQSDYPNLVETSYGQEVVFDSSGDNYGFEVRWYPGGTNGSFSLGLSVEKTTMKIGLPEISVLMTLRDMFTAETASFNSTAGGEFLIKPLSFHFSLRWDIIPSSVVHPYITLGLGAATGTALEDARVSYFYSGELLLPGQDPVQYQDSASKSLKQLKEEMEAEGEDFFLPGFIPIVQLSLGLKARLRENIHLLLDAGIWNGFLLRGGLAVRL